jgi:membrane-associated phospholipid phosphatase
LDWLEAGFRYTDIANRLYGPVIAGDQSYKDKSIDFKLRLMEESAFAPQVALGVRDLGGTGLFSGEYLVANKRWGNWDASLGLGWGYLGARGNIRNPLSVLSKGFDARPGNSTATGGTANFQSMFKGPTALFGGLQWHSPTDNLLLKAELDGNNYQNEPQGNFQTARSPLNLGLVYRYSPFVDFSLGVERGNRLMVGLTVQGELPKLSAPKLLDPALPPIRSVTTSPAAAGSWEATAAAIELHTGWTVKEIVPMDGTLTVVAEVNAAVYLQERIERATVILHQDAGATLSRFVLQLQERGLSLSHIEISRPQWLAERTQAEASSLRSAAQDVLPMAPGTLAQTVPTPAAPGVWKASPRGFSTEWGPSYSQILGGPDGFLLYQLGLQARFEHRWTDQTWISGTANARLLDNYARFVYDAPSNLPRVRTNQREYTTTSRLTIPLLQMTHVAELGRDQFVSAYAGMLEPMYGGIGGEWLYRPWQGRAALGIDINHVRQRDFSQGLSFRDYRVSTGHATLYWDTGWNDVHVNLSAGRYLAGDYGATLDIKRSFPNGVSLGAWATKTNVPAADFGEGSFDKGIYVNIPFDVMMPKSSAGNGTLVWNPLTRDGGARLSRRFPLIDVTRQRDPSAFLWRAFEPSSPATGDDHTYVLGPDKVGLLGSLSTSGKALGMQFADIPASTWLWAGAALLSSSVLDRTVDDWAVNHQGSTWRKMGKTSSALPLALAAGTGLLFTGLAGEEASSTAKTSLTAGLFTVGLNLGTRFTVGRLRPADGEGPYTFNGLNKNALHSGFASNHVALAFALSTPFAQQYNMPWLYALASASALGRVQQREHWLSDTVAGAFLGYAVGSMVVQQQSDQRRMKLSLAPQSVKAEWSFN